MKIQKELKSSGLNCNSCLLPALKKLEKIDLATNLSITMKQEDSQNQNMRCIPLTLKMEYNFVKAKNKQLKHAYARLKILTRTKNIVIFLNIVQFNNVTCSALLSKTLMKKLRSQELHITNVKSRQSSKSFVVISVKLKQVNRKIVPLLKRQTSSFLIQKFQFMSSIKSSISAFMVENQRLVYRGTWDQPCQRRIM